jgi:hypothetical protein
MSAKKTGGRRPAKKASGKKVAGKKAAGKKVSAKKGAAKKNGAPEARKLTVTELTRRFPELRHLTFNSSDIRFEAATTGRVVKSSPVKSRLGDARIEAAVRAVVERRSGRSG